MRGLRTLMAGLSALEATLSTGFWSVVAHVRLRAHGAVVGRGLRVRGPIRLHCHRTGSIAIGDFCRIQSGFGGNPVGGGSRTGIWVGPGARLSLGNRVGLSNAGIVCSSRVTIDDDVFVGGGAQIYDTDFHSLDPDERRLPGNRGARTAPIAIRQEAFIGGYSILLKGTVVGPGAVIGAGSVVRACVPEGELWAGNPARRIREARPRARRDMEGVG